MNPPFIFRIFYPRKVERIEDRVGSVLYRLEDDDLDWIYLDLATGSHRFNHLHANVHNHYNLSRHMINRQAYKARRSAALAEWQNLMV
ncbi:hypothetical protein GRI62_03395 [Erythrobacter arachoides]|uniref:Uncharacterized protein n=1 Tax=Aurantiacibacter arachoides TaxID=1850444 RepID=A0A844ZWH9_9SPHN|nr:hypothetical protein [Aurantiacibacter arachoides]MXO92651.1 hypothetical protein [Aurantiacibacter arachoides]GGD55471.1 hypothetical protein GCM10011411_14360 [Aurantiacibacter arachoides]